MSQQGSNDDSALLLALVAIVVGAVVFAIWYFFGQQLLSLVRWIRYGEMLLVSSVLGGGHIYTDPVYGDQIPLRDLKQFMSNVDTQDLLPEHIGLFTRATLNVLKWPMMAIIGCFAIWSIFRGPGTKFRRKFDLDGMIAEQAKVFPVIRPFVNFNPSKQPYRVPGTPVPAELPLFAEALSPEEWIAYNVIPMPDGVLDEQAAHNAFIKQLGRRWKGISSMRDHEKIIFAACALKSVRKRDEADDLLNEAAVCWTDKHGWVATSSLKNKVEKILRNAKITKPIYMKACQHAYVKTAMLRALQYARSEGGVLASGQFVWMRAHDRELWYPLNNLGRRSFHAEAMGVMAHFQMEKAMERPIPMPQVSSAVNSLKSYIDSHQPIVIPKLDYKGAKKRSGVMKPVGS